MVVVALFPVSAAVVSAATEVARVEEVRVEEMTAAAADVAGPSQSQWLPWDLQPTELVGEGPGPAAVPVMSACDDDECECECEAVLETTGAAVGLGPSQSQWLPWGLQPMELVGLGPGPAAPVLSSP